MKEPPFGQVTTRSPKPKLPACWPKICTFSQEKKCCLCTYKRTQCLAASGMMLAPWHPNLKGRAVPMESTSALEHALAVLKSAAAGGLRAPQLTTKLCRGEAKPAQHLGDESSMSGMREAPNFKQK